MSMKWGLGRASIDTGFGGFPVCLTTKHDDSHVILSQSRMFAVAAHQYYCAVSDLSRTVAGEAASADRSAFRLWDDPALRFKIQTGPVIPS